MTKGKGGRPVGSKDSKPRNADRPFADALRVAIHRAIETGEHKGKVRLNVIAEKLAVAAINGDAWAIKEIADRIDGRPAQQINHSGASGDELPTGIAVVFVPGKSDP
ncbi:hypothetical protein UFOVP1414_7 [uncultured Caudovirales phage]|uniref:Uncharacterized protein n=1 Tax=uncultured Caudovirales phage TaxID=2100421 RepID=A0A6J5SCW7_9CAUD|nr:hypothetical protein UFOVP442_70 [uncultured Caudovirales phage]CAB4211719.1 hypothetical protein UFOVP1414_7 [uncultured Caudovirales phage]